jgi:hypothetical protein
MTWYPRIETALKSTLSFLAPPGQQSCLAGQRSAETSNMLLARVGPRLPPSCDVWGARSHT